MTITSLPIVAVDVGGALLMIIFSFLCVTYALQLKKRDPQNIVWTYLTYVSFALAVFAVSRSMGHIIKQFLILTHRQALWMQLQPYSGAVNSLAFMVSSSGSSRSSTWSSLPGPSRAFPNTFPKIPSARRP